MPSFFAEVKNPTKKILFYLSNLADHDPVLKIVLNSPELMLARQTDGMITL